MTKASVHEFLRHQQKQDKDSMNIKVIVSLHEDKDIKKSDIIVTAYTNIQEFSKRLPIMLLQLLSAFSDASSTVPLVLNA